MSQTVTSVLKSSQIRLTGRWATSDAAAGPVAAAMPPGPTARIVEQSAEQAIIEVVCACGSVIRLRCVCGAEAGGSEDTNH